MTLIMNLSSRSLRRMESRHSLTSHVLTPKLIDDLGYHPYGKWRPLPILVKCCLKILLGLYHHASYELQRPIHLNLVSKATFDHYHLCIYDPEADWLPWYKRGAPHAHPGKPDDEVMIDFCPTDDMIADYMTKPLQGAKFLKFKKLIMGHD
jgi:hypothetical protein